jgi:hypothetical protein
MLTGPVGPELRVARTFLEAWFAIWKDDLGRTRTQDEAERATSSGGLMLKPKRSRRYAGSSNICMWRISSG